MSLDYAALWALTLVNSLVIVLVVRQIALMPKFSRPPGPRPGAPFGEWTLRTLDGGLRESRTMPSEYVMLFASERCNACHALFAQIARHGRPAGHLIVAADSDAALLEAAAHDKRAPLYNDFLVGADVAFMQRHGIPSTPFAIAMRLGRVVASGPARTPDELRQIADVLRPLAAEQAAPV